MIITIDAGNTNLLIGGYRDDALCFTARLFTAVWRTADEWATLLRDILASKGVSAEVVEGAILSSVVPQVTRALAGGVALAWGQTPMIVGPGLKTGLDIIIDNPGQLGSDMVCNAVAALAKYPPPIIIVDMGTATSVSVLDAKGRFRGGAIIPGIMTSVEALSSRAAQLPQIDLSLPSRVIGSSTVECMQSGVLFGAAAVVEGMVLRIEEELGQPCEVLMTGGLSEVVATAVRRPVHHEPTLLPEGLYRIYQKNKPYSKS